jgi:hypothetical protein
MFGHFIVVTPRFTGMGSFVYFASIQESDPVSFTARPEIKIRSGLPFAVPR